MPMPLGITDAVELTKKVADLVKKGITIDLQESVMNLREAVLNAKDEVLELRQERQEPAALLAAQEDWRARTAPYKLVRTDGGAIVWHSEGPPFHFACPTCFEKRSVQVLQDSNSTGGHFYCTSCDKKFPIRREHAFASTVPTIRIVERMPQAGSSTPGWFAQKIPRHRSSGSKWIVG
jgi:hypothetical protein